jgi:hypothetical protein
MGELAKIPKEKHGLQRLRDPFPETDICWRPQPTKQQTDALRADIKSGIRCDLCGGWHHRDVAHLAYVGHAAVTNRLLEVDLEWSWDFIQKDATGGPILDKDGGMWITLTVLGVTRKGYGSADGKTGPNATKEIIGDAIRNAAMRFGAALELWHKGELSKTAITEPDEKPEEPPKQQVTDERLAHAIKKIKGGEYTKERLLKNYQLTDEQLFLVEKELEAK